MFCSFAYSLLRNKIIKPVEHFFAFCASYYLLWHYSKVVYFLFLLWLLWFLLFFVCWGIFFWQWTDGSGKIDVSSIIIICQFETHQQINILELLAKFHMFQNPSHKSAGDWHAYPISRDWPSFTCLDKSANSSRKRSKDPACRRHVPEGRQVIIGNFANVVGKSV